MKQQKFTFVKVITILLIIAKVFSNYDITWVQCFIPIFIGFGVAFFSSVGLKAIEKIEAIIKSEENGQT